MPIDDPSSVYVAGSLMVAAQLLDPSDERFLDQPVGEAPHDGAPESAEPCRVLVLPSALDHRELDLCTRDEGAIVATRELARLYRALWRQASDGRPVPERVEELAAGGSLAKAPCQPEPRPEAALEAWRAVGYDAPATRRVALSIGRAARAPEPMDDDLVRYHRPQQMLQARWRASCDGPVLQARIYLEGSAEYPMPTALELERP